MRDRQAARAPNPTFTFTSSSPPQTIMDPSSSSAYALHTHRIRNLRDSKKTPIVLVACGSFSPITYAHMRMFEMANDYCRQNTNYEVVAGYLSPVGDKYKKPGLLSSARRLESISMVAPSDSLRAVAFPLLFPLRLPSLNFIYQSGYVSSSM